MDSLKVAAVDASLWRKAASSFISSSKKAKHFSSRRPHSKLAAHIFPEVGDGARCRLSAWTFHLFGV